MVRAFKRMQELAANTLICKYIFLNPTKRIRVFFFFLFRVIFGQCKLISKRGKPQQDVSKDYIDSGLCNL